MKMKYLPIGLVTLRFFLGPVLAISCLLGFDSTVYIIILTAGFLSDVFDGIIARKLGVSTERLRSLDSWADTSFYICVFGVSLYLYFPIIKEHSGPILLLLSLEVVRHVFDQIKYGKSASYHMWSAKLWGIFLFLGFVELLGFGEIGVFFKAAVILGILTDIEGLLSSLILSSWRADVPTIYHAYKIEKSS